MREKHHDAPHPQPLAHLRVGTAHQTVAALLPGVHHPQVQLEVMKGSCRVYLNWPMAERLANAMESVDPMTPRPVRLKTREGKREADTPDEGSAKTLEMIAFAISVQLPGYPGYKKTLNEKKRPKETEITLSGFQEPAVKFKKPQPLLVKAADAVRKVMPPLPEGVREVVEAIRAVARTKLQFWKVRPRE